MGRRPLPSRQADAGNDSCCCSSTRGISLVIDGSTASVLQGLRRDRVRCRQGGASQASTHRAPVADAVSEDADKESIDKTGCEADMEPRLPATIEPEVQFVIWGENRVRRLGVAI